jgi:hypothetical protein
MKMLLLLLLMLSIQLAAQYGASRPAIVRKSAILLRRHWQRFSPAQHRLRRFGWAARLVVEH